jgi:hypothetical protein
MKSATFRLRLTTDLSLSLMVKIEDTQKQINRLALESQ